MLKKKGGHSCFQWNLLYHVFSIWITVFSTVKPIPRSGLLPLKYVLNPTRGYVRWTIAKSIHHEEIYHFAGSLLTSCFCKCKMCITCMASRKNYHNKYTQELNRINLINTIYSELSYKILVHWQCLAYPVLNWRKTNTDHQSTPLIHTTRNPPTIIVIRSHSTNKISISRP